MMVAFSATGWFTALRADYGKEVAAMVRLEWRGGMFEEFKTFEQARRAVRVIFPRAIAQPWETTADGNYRFVSYFESAAARKGEPVARILIPLT
jgi:hypothetical protein